MLISFSKRSRDERQGNRTKGRKREGKTQTKKSMVNRRRGWGLWSNPPVKILVTLTKGCWPSTKTSPLIETDSNNSATGLRYRSRTEVTLSTRRYWGFTDFERRMSLCVVEEISRSSLSKIPISSSKFFSFVYPESDSMTFVELELNVYVPCLYLIYNLNLILV